MERSKRTVEEAAPFQAPIRWRANAAATATVVVVVGEVSAFPVAARFVAGADRIATGSPTQTVATGFINAAHVVAGAAVVPIRLHVLDALASAATAWSMANLSSVLGLVADARATVAALAAMIGIRLHVVNARPIAAGAEGGTADSAAELVANWAGEASTFQADFVATAGETAARAIVVIRLQIGAGAVAAALAPAA